MHKKTSIIAISIFATIFSFLLFEANVLVYTAWISLFPAMSSWIYTLLAVKLGLLSGGFIVMLIVEKYSASWLTRILYIVTATWVGIFAYFCIAAAVYELLSLVVADTFVIGIGLFVTALLVGVYGIVHAHHIYVRRISVALPGLPESWRGRTALWMSDLHLGSMRAEGFVRSVVDVSNELTPDIVFIGGDLYDGTQAPDLVAIAQPLADLKSEYGTYFITGNHEEFTDPGPFLTAIRTLGITIVSDACVDVAGLQLIGVDHMHTIGRPQFTELLAGITFDRTRASVLLKHEPRDLDLAEQAGISFQISGHTHRGQQWPFNYLANWVYKGYGYGLKKHGAMDVYVSSGVGGWGPPLRVGSNSEIVFITFV